MFVGTKPFLFLIALSLFIWSCSSSTADIIDGDIAPDGDTENDAVIIDGDSTDTEIENIETDTEINEGSGDSCEFVTDCTNKEDCVDGFCAGAKDCRSPDECRPDQICWFVPGADSAFGVCRVYCATDMDCADNAQCMNGLCEIYQPYEKGTPPPAHAEWNGKLHASYSEEYLEFPMTVTMAGYGMRSGNRSPYAHGMGASAGNYDRLTAKVLTLDDGENRVVFLRLPICFATDFFVNYINKRVIDLGGPDLSDNLVVTSGHSHSGPGSTWNLLPGKNFGSLGFGDFSWEIFHRLATSAAKTIIEGQKEENLKPARFGYAINKNFDGSNKINHNRRDQNPDFKDNNMMLWRIDDMSSGTAKPWVVTVNYATHGTMEGGNDSMLTNDSAGGAEIAIQLQYEKDHPGEQVNVMFFEGMGGDVAPANYINTSHTQRMMGVGLRAYDKAMEMFTMLDAQDNGGNDDIFISKLSEKIDLKVVSKRVPISREYIGYSDDEFYSDGVTALELIKGPFRFGAFQCGLLSTPNEENLDLHVYTEDGEDFKSSASFNSHDKGESVSFASKDGGTYYIKIEGLKGCIAGYALEVFDPSKGDLKGNNCIDASCGLGCDQCPNFKDLPPVDCTEDVYDEDPASNDVLEDAVELTIGTEVTNLQICHYNEDWFKFTATAGQVIKIELRWNQKDEAYNPETKLVDGQLGCGLPIEMLNHGPLPQVNKTRFTSVFFGGEDMGGGLYLSGLPGESLSQLGQDAATYILAETDFDNVVIFGYNNDHHLYIMTADDWYQGGYATSMGFWGPDFGAFCVNHLKKIALDFYNGNEEESANEFPKIKPMIFADKDLTDDTRVPEKTALVEIGVFAENVKTYQPKDTIRMEQQAKMAWVGADAGVDYPHVYIERHDPSHQDADDDGFVQALRSEGSGRIYDDKFYEIRLDFFNEHFAIPGKNDPDLNSYWTCTWEERYNFPAGTYRFRIEGHYYDGPTDSFDQETGVKSYTIYSDSFDLLATGFDVQGFAATATELTGSLRYHNSVSNATTEEYFEQFNNKFGLLLHNEMEVETYLPKRAIESEIATFNVTISNDSKDNPVIGLSDGITFSEDTGTVYYITSRIEGQSETVGSNSGKKVTNFSVPISQLSLAAGSYTATFEITDTYGNTSDSIEMPFVVAK